MERQLTAAELRTLSLANELAGLPPDAPIDWSQWRISRKKKESNSRATSNSAVCGTHAVEVDRSVPLVVGSIAKRDVCGDGDGQRARRACEGCRRLIRGWRGTLGDLAVAVDEGAVVVSHAHVSDLPRAYRYGKV